MPFGPGAWLFISVYLSSLLLIGWISYRARQENTLRDFYLAGSGFGFLVLVLTLYATQYSGNSLFGFTGATYRIGFSWIMSVHFMVAITVFYLAYASRLHQKSVEGNYVTPADYIDDRFDSRLLTLISSILMILVLCNYLLAQLMAMGRALQGLAGENGEQAYNWGVIVLALIMVIYGTLGGIRAVAWTDMIQGVVLMIGFVLLLVVLNQKFGPLSDATEILLSGENAAKVRPPDGSRMREWLSYVLIIGMGGALYPQAIQRIYAAKSAGTLRRSMAVMAFLPFFTVFVSVLTGIYALAYVPGLQGASTDQVLAQLFRLVQEDSVLGYWLVVVIFSAVLSAIMSTADSAMLSISSMFTKDIYGSFLDRSEANLAVVGKLCSWGLIGVLVVLAIVLKDKASLVELIDRKFDVLVQLVPAFLLGVRWTFVKTEPVLTGLVVGVVISLGLVFGNFDFVIGGKVFGFHPGLYGLTANLLIVILGSYLLRRKKNISHPY